MHHETTKLSLVYTATTDEAALASILEEYKEGLEKLIAHYLYAVLWRVEMRCVCVVIDETRDCIGCNALSCCCLCRVLCSQAVGSAMIVSATSKTRGVVYAVLRLFQLLQNRATSEFPSATCVVW